MCRHDQGSQGQRIRFGETSASIDRRKKRQEREASAGAAGPCLLACIGDQRLRTPRQSGRTVKQRVAVDIKQDLDRSAEPIAARPGPVATPVGRRHAHELGAGR